VLGVKSPAGRRRDIFVVPAPALALARTKRRRRRYTHFFVIDMIFLVNISVVFLESPCKETPKNATKKSSKK
jgi:hypothetical protein